MGKRTTMHARARSIARRIGLTRARAAAVRMGAERYTLAAIDAARRGGTAARPGGRILCYHGVDQRQWGTNNVSSARLRRQLELALAAGHRFVAASEIAAGRGEPLDLAVTFDDGLRSVLTAAAPILQELLVPSTLFVVATWADRLGPWEQEHMLGWDDVRRLAERGVTIGSHSLTHPDLATIGEEETRHELIASADEIEARLGVRPTEFAIPFGQSMNANPWVVPAAAAAGYRYVFAQAERTRPAGTIPRSFVSSFDGDRVFTALLRGAFDRWEEWV